MISRPLCLLLLTAWGTLCTGHPAKAQETVIMGFSDINYLATEKAGREGFYSGQLIGHIATSLTDRIAFFGEVSGTAHPEGVNVDIERLILRYDFADFLKVSAGRYHTPISYWNTTYHHGLWLQTSVARPEIIKFGSRFMPVHFMGLLAEGSLPNSRLGLKYFAGLGNGRDQNIGRPGDQGDINNHRAWLVGLQFRPVSVYGLRVGGAIYGDRIATGTTASSDETIYSAHLIWNRLRPEFLAEYMQVVHTPRLGGDNTTSEGFYLQVGYQLYGLLQDLRPYVRLERLDTPDNDLIFSPLNMDYEAIVAGIRYDFGTPAALKAEYRRETFATSTRFDSIYLQVSFTFPNMAAGF